MDNKDLSDDSQPLVVAKVIIPRRIRPAVQPAEENQSDEAIPPIDVIVVDESDASSISNDTDSSKSDTEN
jgi:hypothetical protein